MQTVKKILGVLFLLLTLLAIYTAFKPSEEGSGQSILDSPAASGKLLGSIALIVILAFCGLKLLFSKPKI